MLLQERNHGLYYEGEMENEMKSHQNSRRNVSAASKGYSDTSSCAKNSPPDSYTNGLRRSAFDLASFNSLSTSCSDSSSCYSSPAQNSTTLRYRGQQTSSLSHLREDAATQALSRLATDTNTLPPLQEVREEPVTFTQSLDKNKKETKDEPGQEIASCNYHHDTYHSVKQFSLEGIMLRNFILPILHLTVSIERYFRSLFKELECSTASLFPTAFATSSSFEQAPINFDDKTLRSSLTNLYTNRERGDDNEETCCYSSSSSSSDYGDNESEEDDWGHFADFQDELADESSFFPSCSANTVRCRSNARSAVPLSCIATLATLTETQDEDDETRDD